MRLLKNGTSKNSYSERSFSMIVRILSIPPSPLSVVHKREILKTALSSGLGVCQCKDRSWRATLLFLGRCEGENCGEGRAGIWGGRGICEDEPPGEKRKYRSENEMPGDQKENLRDALVTFLQEMVQSNL